MALYMPAGRRRRRLVLTAAAAVVVGLLLGLALGRLTAPKASDQAQTAKQAAAAVSGELLSLRLAVVVAQRGEIDKATYRPSLVAGLSHASEGLASAMDDAPWLDGAVKERLRQQLTVVRDLADRDAPAPDFEQAIDQERALISSSFGMAR